MENNFKQRVRDIRDKLGFTQPELAREIGVDSITISRWERGVRRPSKLAIRQIERLEKKAGR